ncbi:hypothetical protein [Burkholderia cepacia]|uniref:hypothetical protein n=1 Tax=Burkholderia cepacia TaxID=292 RepID=UPI002AB6D9B8|nr:hypothetical protein [Burkholderia cepacia]
MKKILVIFLMAPAISWAGEIANFNDSKKLQSSSFESRPVGVPNHYAMTPFGYFDPSCIVTIKPGERISVY